MAAGGDTNRTDLGDLSSHTSPTHDSSDTPFMITNTTQPTYFPSRPFNPSDMINHEFTIL